MATKARLDAGGDDDGSGGNYGNKVVVGIDSRVAIAAARATTGGAETQAGVDARCVQNRGGENL